MDENETMPDRPDYLLGLGERLAAPIGTRSGGAPKRAPYGFEEARRRLTTMLATTTKELDALPESACPGGEAVASVTLHPEYCAESHFPAKILRAAELRVVGSRPRRIRPERRSRGRKPEEAPTTLLFVAGRRSSFRRIAEETPCLDAEDAVSGDLPAIESVSALTARERIRRLRGEGTLPLEVVLHASEEPEDNFILAGFRSYLEELGLDPHFRRIFVGRLCFLPLRASALQAREVARFSFVRVLREMPWLRTNFPGLRAAASGLRAVKLPQENALDPNQRAAVPDGVCRAGDRVPGTNRGAERDSLWSGPRVGSRLRDSGPGRGVAVT